jgi:hypothetical protein
MCEKLEKVANYGRYDEIVFHNGVRNETQQGKQLRIIINSYYHGVHGIIVYVMFHMFVE